MQIRNSVATLAIAACLGVFAIPASAETFPVAVAVAPAAVSSSMPAVAARSTVAVHHSLRRVASRRHHRRVARVTPSPMPRPVQVAERILPVTVAAATPAPRLFLMGVGF